MNKRLLAAIISVFLFGSPLVALAQTTDGSPGGASDAQLIAELTQLVQLLEQELQQLLIAHGGSTSASVPTSSTPFECNGNSPCPPNSGGTSPTNSPPTVTLTQSASQTTSDGTTGQAFTISWSATNSTSCTVQKLNPVGVLVDPWASDASAHQQSFSGSQQSTALTIGTYHWWIDCTGPGGTAHADIYHVVVSSAPPSATCPAPQPTSSCNGTWQQVQMGIANTGNNCTIGWMCVPASSGTGSGTSSSSTTIGTGTAQPSGTN